MLHLEYWFDYEPFYVRVVPDHPEHFANGTAARLTLNVDNEINRISDFGFSVDEGGLRVIPHDEIGEAMECLFCRVGVDRSQRSGVPGIEGIEQRSCFDSADFAEDDPIRAPAQSGLQKIIKTDVGFERIRLTFDG